MAVIRASRFDQTHKAVLEESQAAWSSAEAGLHACARVHTHTHTHIPGLGHWPALNSNGVRVP